MRSEEGGSEDPGTAAGAGEEAVDYDAFGTEGVGHASCARSRKDGGYVLGADDESCEDSAVAELQVDVRRKNGERDADGEVTDKGEEDRRENLRGGAAGKFGWARE